MLERRGKPEHPNRDNHRIVLPPSVTIKRPGVMSTSELSAWAQVGRNAIPQLVARFRIRELTGNAKYHRYPISDVLKRIIGVTPETPEDFETLLIPLQKVSWVSQMTGVSVSSISAAACEKSGDLPLPVELTVAGPNQAPARSRRWIPVQVEAYLRGDPIPFLVNDFADQNSPPKLIQAPSRNVFAAICGANAEVSRQFQL